MVMFKGVLFEPATQRVATGRVGSFHEQEQLVASVVIDVVHILGASKIRRSSGAANSVPDVIPYFGSAIGTAGLRVVA